MRYEPAIDLLEIAPFETLRLCLLAVAFRRCLEVFRQRVHAAAGSAAAETAGQLDGVS